MNFQPSEEQREVQELARKILEDLCTHERLKELEAGGDGMDRQLWAELAKANLLGIGVPESHGGSGLGLLTIGTLLEEIGRTVAPVPVLETLVLGGLVLERFGSEEQQRRWLPGIASGEHVLTGALLEGGSEDPAHPATRARRAGDGFALDGVKECVPYAHAASRVLLTARVSDAEVAIALVDPAAEGVRLERQQVTSRLPHFRLVLEDARVAPGDLLGPPAEGAAAARWIADHAAAAACFVQLGVSDRALRMTAEYTTSRHQFDRAVGSFQAVHQRAGDAYVAVEAMRLTAWQAAFRLARGLPDEGALAVAKFWAAEGGQLVGYAAQHLHGGIGIDVDYPLHRYYLWSKQIELGLGSAPRALAHLGDQLARDGS